MRILYNEGARYYRYTIDWKSTITSSTILHPYKDELYLTITWGNDYLASAHGIFFSIRNAFVLPGGTYHCYVDLHTPFGSYSYDFGALTATTTYTLEIGEMDHSVDSSCYAWDQSYSYVKLYNAAGTLVYSEGANTTSGVDWDKRLTATEWEHRAEATAFDTIDTIDDSEASFATVISNSSRVREEISPDGSSWSYPPLYLYAPGGTPVVTCPSGAGTLGYLTVEYDPTTGRLEQVVHDTTSYTYTRTAELTTSCPCSDGAGHTCGTGAVVHYKTGTALYLDQGLIWFSAPTDSGMNSITRHEAAICEAVIAPPFSGAETEDIFSETLSQTCIQLIRTGLRAYKVHSFQSGVFIFPLCCPGYAIIIDECVPGAITGTWAGRENVLWDAVTCQPEESDFTIISPQVGYLIEAYISHDDVFVRSVDYQFPPYSVDVQVTSSSDCSSPWLAWDGEKAILGYMKGTDATRSVSYDLGAAWYLMGNDLTNSSYCVGREKDGQFIHAAVRFISGINYKIVSIFQDAGNQNPTSEYYFQDDTSTDILVENERFDLDFGGDHMIMIVKVKGETVSSKWVSYDRANGYKSWKRLA